MREPLETDHYPTPEHYRCEWVDLVPDMYPEFAPEPLSIECDANATAVVAWWADDTFGFGLPEAEQLCEKHADMLCTDLTNGEHMPPRPFVRINKDGSSTFPRHRVTSYGCTNVMHNERDCTHLPPRQWCGACTSAHSL